MNYPMKKIARGLPINKADKGQASIEFTLAFVMALFFLVLTCRVFVWFNGNLLRRQIAYEKSRVEAGSTNPGKLDFYAAPKLDLFGKDIFK